jgi:hypothetical protein
MTEEFNELSPQEFSMPWQYSTDGYESDPDGFSMIDRSGTDDSESRSTLQDECWKKFCKNPQMNTSVRGLVGRLTGFDFGVTSDIKDIQEVIEEIEYDPRNKLYSLWPSFVGRANIEGELFLCLSCHTDGFIEVDFIDPGTIKGCGSDDSGIIFHPTKTHFPLFYNIEISSEEPIFSNKKYVQIPSINIARYPELISIAKNSAYWDDSNGDYCKDKNKKFKQFGGYFRFIISWNRGFVQKRNFSFLRTTLEWMNHYENLKKFEIDHKKSAGSYLWIFNFEDIKAFKQWAALSDEERKKTGILAKKTPGGSLILPPGIKVDVKSPTLPAISNTDTDIMQMIASGLNEPEDILTGTSSGTYASVKASRGPMSDRTSDEVAYFERFLRHEFWGNIFFLKSKLTKFPEVFAVKEAVDFNNKKEPIFKKVKRKPEFLIGISFPISETVDLETRAKALLGVKHGNMSASLGIPNSEIARRLGIGGYGYLRLKKATEDARYPDLLIEADFAAASVDNPKDKTQTADQNDQEQSTPGNNEEQSTVEKTKTKPADQNDQEQSTSENDQEQSTVEKTKTKPAKKKLVKK